MTPVSKVILPYIMKQEETFVQSDNTPTAHKRSI